MCAPPRCQHSCLCHGGGTGTPPNSLQKPQGLVPPKPPLCHSHDHFTPTSQFILQARSSSQWWQRRHNVPSPLPVTRGGGEGGTEAGGVGGRDQLAVLWVPACPSSGGWHSPARAASEAGKVGGQKGGGLGTFSALAWGVPAAGVGTALGQAGIGAAGCAVPFLQTLDRAGHLQARGDLEAATPDLRAHRSGV